MAKIFFSLHKKEKKKEKENARENPENILLAHNPHYCSVWDTTGNIHEPYYNRWNMFQASIIFSGHKEAQIVDSLVTRALLTFLKIDVPTQKKKEGRKTKETATWTKWRVIVHYERNVRSFNAQLFQPL